MVQARTPARQAPVDWEPQEVGLRRILSGDRRRAARALIRRVEQAYDVVERHIGRNLLEPEPAELTAAQTLLDELPGRVHQVVQNLRRYRDADAREAAVATVDAVVTHDRGRR